VKKTSVFLLSDSASDNNFFRIHQQIKKGYEIIQKKGYHYFCFVPAIDRLLHSFIASSA